MVVPVVGRTMLKHALVGATKISRVMKAEAVCDLLRALLMDLNLLPRPMHAQTLMITRGGLLQMAMEEPRDAGGGDL